LAGLKEVIKRAGVQSVTTDDHNNRLIMTPAGRNIYDIFVGTATSLDIRVYNTAGGIVKACRADGPETTLDLDTLPAGIYIVDVNNHTKKIAVQ
ncbi:MAG: T9SS type A sorting domain-containing protein, partial [Muribaculaceae bacterium]|nr:T9SS type A sorting domain-containing protein [Muribaculaceae bacterium]